jgi:hypothetical protein
MSDALLMLLVVGTVAIALSVDVGALILFLKH